MTDDEAVMRYELAVRYITLKDTPKARRRCRKRTLRTLSLLESHRLAVRSASEPDMSAVTAAQIVRGCEICGRCKTPPEAITQQRPGAR